jgi:hypothetical protein
MRRTNHCAIKQGTHGNSIEDAFDSGASTNHKDAVGTKVALEAQAHFGALLGI